MVDTPLPATYILPIKIATPASAELTAYLRTLSALLPVIVVDGSPPRVLATHHEMWSRFVNHVPAISRTVNGKVAGIVDGIAAAATPLVVIADDDVRYDEAGLRRLVSLLDEHPVVVPQNFFAPLPWHARWDSARSLLNRALGHDYAGTAGIRREPLLTSRGYCGAVLFENLEMLRTLSSQGHHVLHADDLYVVRLPPTFQHFLDQRVRQAFDSGAQPLRLLVELAALPALLLATTSRPWSLPVAAVASILLAEMGRRRAGGSTVFAWHLPLWAPCWVVERSVAAWLAVGSRVRGGVPYAGQRLTRSAHSTRRLAGGACPEGHCRCDTVLRPLPSRAAA